MSTQGSSNIIKDEPVPLHSVNGDQERQGTKSYCVDEFSSLTDRVII